MVGNWGFFSDADFSPLASTNEIDRWAAHWPSWDDLVETRSSRMRMKHGLGFGTGRVLGSAGTMTTHNTPVVSAAKQSGR
jgi:hypothetical protein